MATTDQTMNQFFSRLSYSFGNEDWLTESEALQVKPDSRVLCISASGDRPLHLLLNECAQVVAVDANPVQNYLLDLKSTALRTLNYDEYIGFLGGTPSHSRLSSLHKVLPHLSDEVADFWKKNQKYIEKGVLYQGVVERFTKMIARFFSLVRPLKTKKIFEMKNLEDQKKYLKEWDTPLFRKSFDIILNRHVSRFFAIDPGLYLHSDPGLSLGSYIYGRMIDSLNYSLAKDNLLFSLMFRGYVEPSAFPPYLNRVESEMIRRRLDRLVVKTENILDHLENTPDNYYDRYSLSDIASYLNQASFHRLISQIYRTAKPGARFCLRQFSSNQQIPSDYEQYFKRELFLEKKLEKEDRCFVYRFMVGEIVK